MLQMEYYVVERENNNYPLLACDQSGYQYGSGVPISVDEPLKFRLREPVSSTFKLADFHKAPQPVISPLLASALAPLDIYGMQLIPARLRNPEDPFAAVHDYWFVHVWNRIACLDRSRSDLVAMNDGMIFSIDTFVMDEAALNQIELNKRLVFELEEKPSVLLVHQSIKDAIESVKPKGIRLIPAVKWNSDITFDLVVSSLIEPGCCEEK